MKRILLPILAAVAALCFPAPVFAQFTTVSASGTGGAGHLVANGTVYWQPVTGFRIGTSSGQALNVPYSATVTAGAFSLSIPDTSLSNPAYPCYAVTVIDNLTGDTLIGAGLAVDGIHVNTGGAYGCVQPSGSTWSFDSFVPATPPGALVVAGPPGPVGVLNQRGAWAATTAYAKDDGFTEAGGLYIVTAAYTSGSTFGSTDTSNSVEVNTVNGSSILPSCVGNTCHTSGFPSSCTVNSVGYSTQGDCAFYTLLYIAQTTGVNQILKLDPPEVDTAAGWDEPVLANSASVSLGTDAAYPGSGDIYSGVANATVRLKQTASIGTKAVITYESGAVSSGAGPVATVGGFYIDANNNAGACLDALRLATPDIGNLKCSGVTGTHRHGVQIGSHTAGANGAVYEAKIHDITVYPQTLLPFTFGSGQVQISGGSAVGYTLIAQGGSGSFTGPTSAYAVIFAGSGVGVSQPSGPSPCTTIPTAHVSSIVGGQLEGIAFDTAGSGCDPNNTFFEVTIKPIMDEAVLLDQVLDAADITNLVSAGPVGVAGFYISPYSSSFKLTRLHGYGGDPAMLYLGASNVVVDSLDCDTPIEACVEDFGNGNTISAASRENSSFYPGAVDFFEAGQNNKYAPTGGCLFPVNSVGYSAFAGPTGPWNTRSAFPLGSATIENVDFCSPGGTGVQSISASGGSGMTPGTYALSFSGGGGSGATGTITVTSSTVAAIAINAEGSSFTSAPSVSAATGGTPPTLTAILLPIVNLGYPYPITAFPSRNTYTAGSSSSSGGSLHFSTAASGITDAECVATAGAPDTGAVPGFDPATNLVTFPADLYQNGGSIACTMAVGQQVSRTIVTTGTSPQTFNMTTMLSASAGSEPVMFLNPVSAYDYEVGANVVVPYFLSAYTGNSSDVYLQTSDGSGAAGTNYAVFAVGGATEAGPLKTAVPQSSSTTPLVNTAACIKTVGPPAILGYCSTALTGTPPTCTCN